MFASDFRENHEDGISGRCRFDSNAILGLPPQTPLNFSLEKFNQKT